MVEGLSQQRLSVRLIYVYHCLAKRNKNKRHQIHGCKYVVHHFKFSIWRLSWENVSTQAHHVPKLVEGHYKAWAHSPQSLEGPDVNFDPYPLLNASIQLPQWTALAYWKHMTGDTNYRRIHLKHKKISAKKNSWTCTSHCQIWDAHKFVEKHKGWLFAIAFSISTFQAVWTVMLDNAFNHHLYNTKLGNIFWKECSFLQQKISEKSYGTLLAANISGTLSTSFCSSAMLSGATNKR